MELFSCFTPFKPPVMNPKSNFGGLKSLTNCAAISNGMSLFIEWLGLEGTLKTRKLIFLSKYRASVCSGGRWQEKQTMPSKQDSD